MNIQPNISNIAYMAFRLSPFIIVCFFTLESFLNWNLKGIVYLFGLLFACTLNILASNSIPKFNAVTPSISSTATATVTATPKALDNICVSFSLGNGNSNLSGLPLSTAVFSYTFIYLLTFIISIGYNGAHLGKDGKLKSKSSNSNISMKDLHTSISNAMIANVPTLILFPLLIIVDIGWNLLNGCASPIALGASAILSGIVGVCWASIIVATNNPNLLYISNSIGDVCSKPTATMFRCRTKNAKSDSTIASIPKIHSAADIVEVTEGELKLPTLQPNKSIPTGQKPDSADEKKDTSETDRQTDIATKKRDIAEIDRQTDIAAKKRDTVETDRQRSQESKPIVKPMKI